MDFDFYILMHLPVVAAFSPQMMPAKWDITAMPQSFYLTFAKYFFQTLNGPGKPL